jgi:hypothetical protein
MFHISENSFSLAQARAVSQFLSAANVTQTTTRRHVAIQIHDSRSQGSQRFQTSLVRIASMSLAIASGQDWSAACIGYSREFDEPITFPRNQISSKSFTFNFHATFSHTCTFPLAPRIDALSAIRNQRAITCTENRQSPGEVPCDDSRGRVLRSTSILSRMR